MKKVSIILALCAIQFAFVPVPDEFQTDYYAPYCVDGHGWLGTACDRGATYSLDQSNQMGKRHEQATKGHRWDNKFCRTGGK